MWLDFDGDAKGEAGAIKWVGLVPAGSGFWAGAREIIRRCKPIQLIRREPSGRTAAENYCALPRYLKNWKVLAPYQ
jgi:hypothetical protein